MTFLRIGQLTRHLQHFIEIYTPLVADDPRRLFHGRPEPSYGIGQKFFPEKIIRTKPWDHKKDRDKFYYNRDVQSSERKSKYDQMPHLSQFASMTKVQIEEMRRLIAMVEKETIKEKNL